MTEDNPKDAREPADPQQAEGNRIPAALWCALASIVLGVMSLVDLLDYEGCMDGFASLYFGLPFALGIAAWGTGLACRKVCGRDGGKGRYAVALLVLNAVALVAAALTLTYGILRYYCGVIPL